MKLEEQRLGGTTTADALQELVLASADLDEFLGELARLAADGLSRGGLPVVCAVRVARPKKPARTGAGGPHALALAQMQSRDGDGPAIAAMGEARTVYIRDLTQGNEWPEFGKTAAAGGYLAVLSIPITLDDKGGSDHRAAVSFYAGRRSGFTAGDIGTAEDFARQASRPLRLSLRIDRLQEARDDLEKAMQSRAVIDMAIGVIMAQNRCRPDEAITVLRKASNARNTKVRDVAASIVASIAGTTDIHSRFEV
ncbi:GAF and ANTAR domain-containing protein [Arthrobacter oryzae]|uniref:ANTAR domain-containing protein n=1 Tax=Arthrobacter oryzae TaxID=409290 RepID=A0A495FL79_9MICC|nr:GAF and ANTAR domain-containing protein [Arthrobacter oryzae]RKR29983.1 ANTAR domain-containing protein [Arthrobacter oryzae]